MGTTKISKFLFNKNNKLTKQYDEPIVEKNLYTILGFKGREDFENKTSKFNKEVWKLFVDCFVKEIDYMATEQVVKNIVCNIAKSDRGDAFIKTERLILNEEQGSKKREKAIKKAIGILRKFNPEKAFNELSVIKKQAEDFLQTNFYKAQSKPLQGFVSSGGQLFAETLKYVETLEKLSEVKREKLIKDFLLSHLNKKYPELRGKREDAIAILSNDELRNLYDKGVKGGILFPMASYKECKNLYDQAKNESKGVIEREERLQKIDKSTISIINDIKKYREAILSCKDFQSSYIKEKKEHPFRDNACQKMIDIYQERIAGYQEKMRQNLTKIREMFKDMLQEMGSLYNVEEFEELVHKTEQAGEEFDSALSNIQSKMENPLIELVHVNDKLKLTRL